MPVPTLITDLSTTAASNYPAGTEAPNVIDDTLRAHAAFIAQLRDGPVTLGLASVTAPAYAFVGDTNTGMWSPAADTLAWSTGGSERARIGSDGQAMFGATTGLGNGAGHLTARGSTPRLMLQPTSDVQTARLEAYNTAGTFRGRWGYDFTDDYWWLTTAGTTERLRVDSSGNFIPTLNTSAPTLSTNLQMVFALTSNTNLRISVRGSDGTTRVANITLA